MNEPHDHKPVQHRDRRPPWCDECGRDTFGAIAKDLPVDHRHDFRVDPSQVVISIRDRMRLRVACAGCPTTATVESAPNPTVDTNNVDTWRPYRWKQGDLLVLGETP